MQQKSRTAKTTWFGWIRGWFDLDHRLLQARELLLHVFSNFSIDVAHLFQRQKSSAISATQNLKNYIQSKLGKSTSCLQSCFPATSSTLKVIFGSSSQSASRVASIRSSETALRTSQDVRATIIETTAAPAAAPLIFIGRRGPLHIALGSLGSVASVGHISTMRAFEELHIRGGS